VPLCRGEIAQSELPTVALSVERPTQGRGVRPGESRALGLDPAISQTNFCWFSLGEERDEAEVMRGLEERGVLVRAGGALGREGSLRVTYGTPEENERFLAALAEVL